MKICRKCNETKDLSDFPKNKNFVDGLNKICTTCNRAHVKTWRLNNPQNAKNSKTNQYNKHREKILESQKLDRQNNPEKYKERQARRYRKHKDKILAANKRYYENNKKSYYKTTNRWKQNNPDKIRGYVEKRNKCPRVKEYKSKWLSENREKVNSIARYRRKTDPQFRLRELLRSRLLKALAKNFKSGSAVRDLGMPIPAFLTYLNLDCIYKYGEPYTGNEQKYHLDHIQPLSSFDLTDRNQLLIACNWSNLQILTVEENLSKGAKTA